MNPRRAALALALTLAPVTFAPIAAAAPATGEDLAALDRRIAEFAGAARPLGRRDAPQACAAPPALSRLGARAVAIRCESPPWRRIVALLEAPSAVAPAMPATQPARLVAARAIARDALIAAADVALAAGPAAGWVLTDPADAIGQVATRALAPGAALRRENLRAPAAIKRGAKVALVVQGAGFSVEAIGDAETDAAVGAPVGARNPSSGERLKGVATPEGSVRLTPLNIPPDGRHFPNAVYQPPRSPR